MSVQPPKIPDYTLLRCIGRGSYGEVWLARGVTGLHRAVKIVHRSSFSEDRPYEREFSGIKRFQAVSHSQENLVNILHVGRNDEAGYFYYLMELADPAGAAGPWRTPGSDLDAGGYQSGTLKQLFRARGRLPVTECLTIAKGLARAIEHLHANGLIHRDIKPSNVIFVNGVPKLADVGLVAGLDESRSFVGTEGFVPPEGPGTVGADLFALGRLLYEMSTGRDRLDYPRLPEDFDQLSDRAALIEFNEIVLKAGDPERNRRYASADELVRDLLLLEAGKSVRRLRLLESRFALVSRTAAAAVTVMVLALAAWLWATFQAREARRNYATSERHRLAAETALRDVLLNQVRANRQSGWMGQRLESLRLLRENLTITNNLAFRNEAIACLALPDAQPWRAIPLPPGTRWIMDRQLTRYATNDRAGAIWVRSSDDDRLLHVLPSPGAGIYRMGYSDDDRKIGASYLDRRFVTWDLEKYPAPADGRAPEWDALPENVRPLRVLLPAGATAGAGVPGREQLAALGANGRLHIINVTNGAIAQEMTLEPAPGGIRFNASGLKLAGGHSNECVVYRTRDGARLFTLPHPASVTALAWHPDGRRLATTCFDFKVRIWDTLTGQQISGFEDHEAESVGLDFDETGSLMVTSSWDDITRLWAPESARALVRIRGSGNGVRLAADGTRLAYSTWNYAQLVLSKILPGRELVSLERFSGIYGLTFSPDSRFIVAGSADGLHVWQWPYYHPVATLPVRECPVPSFVPDNQHLLAAGRGVAADWPFQIDDAHGRLSVGPVRELAEVNGPSQIYLSPDGHEATLRKERVAQRYRREGDLWTVGQQIDGKVSGCYYSPDRQWMAVARSNDHLDVLDARGILVTNFDCGNATVAAFSADGQWLMLGYADRYQAIRTGSWEPGPAVLHGAVGRPRECLDFAAEAPLAVFRTEDRELSLIDLTRWEILATIPIRLHTTAAVLSSDGARLGVATEKRGVEVWDLARIRSGLVAMGLDWNSKYPVARTGSVWSPMLEPSVEIDRPRLTNDSPVLAARIPARAVGTPAACIDLSDYYNASLPDGWIPSFQLGTTAEHALPIPLGTNRWAGVDFDVRGAIQLSSSVLSGRGARFPEQISGIPIRRRCQRLHFLHGTDSHVKHGATIGGYVVRFVTGEEELVRMTYGRNVLDWWMEPPSDGGTNAPVVAWTGDNVASRRQHASLRVYRTTWENPRWDVPIQSIDFASTRTACGPFLLGLTTE